MLFFHENIKKDPPLYNQETQPLWWYLIIFLKSKGMIKHITYYIENNPNSPITSAKSGTLSKPISYDGLPYTWKIPSIPKSGHGPVILLKIKPQMAKKLSMGNGKSKLLCIMKVHLIHIWQLAFSLYERRDPMGPQRVTPQTLQEYLLRLSVTDFLNDIQT